MRRNSEVKFIFKRVIVHLYTYGHEKIDSEGRHSKNSGYINIRSKYSQIFSSFTRSIRLEKYESRTAEQLLTKKLNTDSFNRGTWDDIAENILNQ